MTTVPEETTAFEKHSVYVTTGMTAGKRTLWYYVHNSTNYNLKTQGTQNVQYLHECKKHSGHYVVDGVYDKIAQEKAKRLFKWKDLPFTKIQTGKGARKVTVVRTFDPLPKTKIEELTSSISTDSSSDDGAPDGDQDADTTNDTSESNENSADSEPRSGDNSGDEYTLPSRNGVRRSARGSNKN